MNIVIIVTFLSKVLTGKKKLFSLELTLKQIYYLLHNIQNSKVMKILKSDSRRQKVSLNKNKKEVPIVWKKLRLVLVSSLS